MKTLPSHQLKAQRMASALADFRDDLPIASEVVEKLSVTIPVGLMCAVELLAERTQRGNRSAAATDLLTLGHGLLLESMSPEKREAWQAELMARMAEHLGEE